MKRQKTGGFTLLELIIVLIIIGISSALVVPRFMGGMGGLDLKAAAGKVAASLRYARSQAVAQKTSYTATFDREQNRLTISSGAAATTEGTDGADEEGSTISREKRYDLPEGLFFKRMVEEDGTYVEEDDTESFGIGFYPSGGSDGGAVAVANERGGRYIITIDIITGAVTLARGEEE